MLIREARAVCGLVPTGHKFVLYAPWLADGLTVLEQGQLEHFHRDLDGYTPPADRDAGRHCRAQAEGVVVAGVPLGGARFARDFAHERLDAHMLAHQRVRVLRCVQSAYIIVRYCLALRFVHLLRGCGQVLRVRDDDRDSPVARHDSVFRDTLAALLTRADLYERRAAATAQGFHGRVFRQAALPPKLGGVALACADAVCESAFLACTLACLVYLRAHGRLLRAPVDLSERCALPMFDALRLAHARLRTDSVASVQDLSHLLSGSTPPPQRVLSEGVWDKRQALVRAEQPDRRERTRVCSAAGQHAGAWLGAVPVSDRLRALPRSYQLALCMRLGVEISDLAELPRPALCVCGAAHDAFGWHPSVCRKGNRENAWTVRHDTVQWALIWVLRRLRGNVSAVGKRDMFGSAAMATVGRALHADIVAYHWRAPGRHLWVDVAVTTPDTAEALRAGSAEVSGTAARLRERKKHSKYGATVDRVGGCFRAGVMERFGAVGDDMQAMVRGACGDLDRDRGEEDWAFSAPSQVTYYMQHIVLAGVMADAAMVDAAIEADVYRRDLGAVRAG